MKRILYTCIWLAVLASGGSAQTLFEGNPVPPEVEAAYIKGLQYLEKTQQADGRWSGHYGGGTVGLVLAAMLAHGDDPNTGPYKETIRRCILFLLSNADPKTGMICRAEPGRAGIMYDHGFATMALAEAFGMVNDPGIGPVLQRAVDLIVASQKRNPQGAWRYSPESVDADSTVSGAQMMALYAARNAGIEVPDEAIEKGLAYYRSCQDGDGGIGYSGGPGNLTRTAIGALVFALADRRNTPAFAGTVKFLRDAEGGRGFKSPPSSEAYYHYALYYVSQAAFHIGEETWAEWNAAPMRAVLGSQVADGSWPDKYCPAYSTACALLSLALNYRYLPIYERRNSNQERSNR